MRSPSYSFILMLLVVGTVTWARADESHEPDYRVIETAGETGFKPSGSTRVSPLIKNMSLQKGDQLVTGKSGRIQFATKQGTVMELKENSRLEVDSVSTQISHFFLRVGRLLGKFAPASQTQHRYSIRTPIAVASIRGTELAMCVEENGETQAGVNEGVVSFEKTSNEKSTEPTGEVLVEEKKGVVVKPNEVPVKTNSIPPLVVNDLVWFPSIREQIPTLKEQWKDLSLPAKNELRQQALRDQVKWKAPEFNRPEKPHPDHLK